jgi:hypothetical protein
MRRRKVDLFVAFVPLFPAMKTRSRLIAFAISLVLSIVVLGPMPAFADGMSPEAMAAIKDMMQSVPIQGGTFSVTKELSIPPLPKPLRIAQAIVSLSPEPMKRGLVKSIKITGPNGIEFGCVNLKVEPGTDLIKSCGGPALLESGPTVYEANGVDFGPEQNGTFSVDLIPS